MDIRQKNANFCVPLSQFSVSLSAMTLISATEEDYLKTIYKLAEKQTEDQFVNTNAIAAQLNTKAASVTDMLKRLNEKDLLVHRPYKGVQLSLKGNQIARNLVRKHRLWEVFLVETLHFQWDEVHEIAEQLEHIHSAELIDRLDDFLDNPKFDPHGDPIPDKDGHYTYLSERLLAEFGERQRVQIVGVKDHSTAFLRYLADQKLVLNTDIEIIKIHDYDFSMDVRFLKTRRILTISQQVAQNLYVIVPIH
jgi:DtxR family Mn-dependent transcriptional regulator